MPNEGVDVPYELTRNPAIIPRKRRKDSHQAISSTRRDPSHWELQGRGRGSVTHGGSEVGGRGTGRGRAIGRGRATGRGRETGRGRATGRGTGRGRGISRGRGTRGGRGRGSKSEAPIELSDDASSISSDPSEFEIYVQAAREKRMCKTNLG